MIRLAIGKTIHSYKNNMSNKFAFCGATQRADLSGVNYASVL